MAKILGVNGKISEIKLNGSQTLSRAVGGSFSLHYLLSGDVIVHNDTQWPEALPLNDLATVISNHKLYGDCVLCDPKEID